MSSAICPICNETVNINNINTHIDSNCKLFIQRKKKITKTQSNLTQYFHIKKQCNIKPLIKSHTIIANSKKRKRETNDENSNTESPNKRIKLSETKTVKESMDIDQKEKEEYISSNNSKQYEPFECSNKLCMSLSQLTNESNKSNDIKQIDMECMYFDQRIVGQKFCLNKTYKIYKAHRTCYDCNQLQNTDEFIYLDLIHEFDNPVDKNAIVIVECIHNSNTNNSNNNNNKSIIALGYLPKTLSQYICDLIKHENIKIYVYKHHKSNDSMVRIHIRILSKQNDMNEIMDKINALSVIINKNKKRKDLYFDILSNIFVSCFKKYSHLFPQNELDLLNKMIELTNNSKTNDAIKLLSRLMLRKVKWFKIDCLSYDEITDIKHAISILIKHGILTQSEQLGVTEDLLHCVSKDILIQLSNKTGLKVKKSGTNCDELIKSLMHQINTQKTIFGVKLSKNKTFLNKCHSIIGKFISITEFAMDILNKCQLLFYLHPNKSIQDTVLSHIGITKYPKYKLFNDECKSETIIFPTKQIFMDYTNALQFRAEYDEMYAQYIKQKKAKANESELILKINQCTEKLNVLIKQKYLSENINNSMYSFVSSYRDITIYARTLHRGVTDVIEKLDMKQHKKCCEIYQQLLSCQTYSYSRGKWFGRLALLLHHHLKKHKLAYTVCNDALHDNYVEMSDRNELIKRYHKLHKILDLKHKLKIPIPKSSCFALNKGQYFIDSNKFKYIQIGGKPVNCETGEKSRYFGFDDSIVSVEELVLQYFEQEEHGAWNGIHCEGSIYKMIFTVFMWHIIFTDNISYVFQTKYQNAPLDMNTEWFYLNRKELIETYINNVLTRLSDNEMEDIINKIYLKHFGENVIGIYWDRFNLNEFIEICKAIGGYAIAQICLLLAKNYKWWSGGLPDLLLWRKVHNSNEFECKIVEVKGARDHLSEKQNCWIEYMTKYAKLDVWVAKIKEEF